MLGAGLMLAHQVAGKAVRDGLFLSRFSPVDLPKIVVAAAVVAVLLSLAFARILAREGPSRLIPTAFGAGALLHLFEYLLLQIAGETARAVVIAVVYVHIVGFGAILLSGFWSLANEVFDPREAKGQFGRIAGAGTAGGIVGGLLAERGAALFGVDSLLLLLAGFHLAAALTLRRAGTRPAANVAPFDGEVWGAAREAFRHAPFLVNLAVLVLMGSMSAALLDYLFKSGAAAAYGKGPQLTRYFALFYTGGQVLTFAVQSFLVPVALRRLGLGRTIQWHPAAVAAGTGASFLFPQLGLMPLARGLELIFRGSFLRSSYELFFTPVPPREKRATKTFIDVSCDRMGDALGAAILQVLLLLGPRQAVTPILLATVALAAVGYFITRRMDAAYAGALEHGLLSRAVDLDEADVQDSTTLAALLHSTMMFRGLPPQPQAGAAAAPPIVRVHDPVLSRLADLRSAVLARVKPALAPDQPFDAAIVPQAIRLLAWNEAFEWARAFLLRHAHRAVGQLVDALLDPEQDFAVRRRIPHILAYTSSQRAVDGLTAALTDSRFEIRFNSSRALEFLNRMGEGLRFDNAALMDAVEAELSTSQSIRKDRKLLDCRGENDSQYWYLDEVLRDRADKSLEHVFSLLAIQLPLQPLKVAFRALHGNDAVLRGLAVEYLESHVPASKLHVAMFLAQSHDGVQPDQRKPYVDPREAREREMKLRSQAHHPGIQHVTETHEERVDGSLGLVLSLAGSGQKQGLPQGVLDRVVGGVLQDLGPTDQAKDRHQSDQRVADQRDGGHDIQRPPHSQGGQNPRDGEHLHQQAQQVDGGKEAAVETADELLLRRCVGGEQLVSVSTHQVAEQELASGVHHVQDHDQDGDPGEVAIAEHHRESVAGSQLLLPVAGHFGNGFPGSDAVDDHQETAANYENQGGQQLEPVGRKVEDVHEPFGALRTEPGTHAASDSDHGEETFALSLGIDVVGEGPHLADHKDVEDPHPDVEDHSFARAAHTEQVEQRKVNDEEKQQAQEQPDAHHLRAHVPVKRHQDHQQRRLARAGIGFDVRAALRKNQGFANSLQQVVREEQEKDVQSQEKGVPTFAATNIGNNGKQLLDTVTGPFRYRLKSRKRPRAAMLGSRLVLRPGRSRAPVHEPV